VLNPCKCDENGIKCGGNNALNLKHVFENINQNLGENDKHFKQFYLNNTVITEIEENTFFEVTFDEIVIEKAANLTSINSHAFTSTNMVTKRFRLSEAPIVNSPPNYDVFLLSSSFINLETLTFAGTQISEIPSYAFRPINGIQSKLTDIVFGFSKIEKIGNYSFYDLKNLISLSIYNNPLKLISMNSFNFRNVSNQTLVIYLYGNALNGSSFAINSLSNIKRPTELHLFTEHNLKFLDETIFLPFFESNPKNKIILSALQIFDCDDCRSHWLVKESKYLERFDVQILCKSGDHLRDLKNSSNFKNCK
jgi:hypothetical protein